MSWNNTVTCSWCYKTGHNRNGCSDRKQHVVDNPESYEARRDNVRKSRGRKCSYCEGHGHTRRTCHDMKEDRKNLLAKNVELRIKAYNHLCAEGLAPGTIFTINHWSQGKLAAMVNRLEWASVRIDNGFTENFPANSNGSFIVYTQLNTGDSGYVIGVGEIEQIVSPVSSSAVDIGMPMGWLNSTDKHTTTALDQLQKDQGLSLIHI